MTDRDELVVDFISKIPCFSDTIQKLFFPSDRVTNRRLAHLVDYNYLKRTREGSTERYFYYVNREPKQKRHMDFMAKTYYWMLQNGYNIKEFEVQHQVDNIRPDLLLTIEQNGKEGIIPVEVELSNNDIHKKIRKYEENNTFKKLLLVSGYTRKSDKIDIINLNLKTLKTG